MRARKQGALKSARTQPGGREGKYRSMVENATEGIFQVTPDGRFLSVNPALARIAGYDSPEEMMKNTADLAQQAYLPPERRLEYLKLLKTEGRVSNFECRLHSNNGTSHWVCINSQAVCDKAGKVLYFEGHLQDITERKLAEEQLILQRDLALELAKVSSLDEALSLTLHAVTQATGCDCAGIYLRNSATGDLELASSVGLPGEFLKEVAHAAVGSDAWSFVNRKKESPAYFSVHENKKMAYREALLAEGIRSVAVIPVAYEGGVIACFNAASRGADTIPASSRSTLELIGAQFGNIIARLQAEEEVQKDLEKRKQMEETLDIKARSLEEMNSALKVLLNGREKDKYEVAERVMSNVDHLIQPYVRKLKTSKLDVSQETWVDIIETNLQEITSPFLKNASTFNFTPKEHEVIQLLKEGKSTKEIAELLHVCEGAIELHRHRVRKSWG